MMPPQRVDRRSACLECVRVKKKCDQKLPQCQRCQNRQMNCVYPHNERNRSDVSLAGAGPSVLQVPWIDEVYPFATSSSISWGSPQSIDGLITAEPPPYLDPAEPEMSQMSREEMNFCVSQFIEYPLLWLQSGSTPFIHSALYQNGIPEPLKAAYSASAVFATTSTRNSDMAWNVIEFLSNKVLEDSRRNESSHTPLDILAHVQSLCILQIIRLFGSDIRQRHLAELAEPSIAALTACLTTMTISYQNIRADNSTSWRSWIFAEAVRRTIIMSLMIRGVYSLVKQGYCNLAPAVSEWSFSAQKGLWTAQNPVEWRNAIHSAKEYWIDRMTFGELLSQGTKSELEEMGMLMAVTYCGRVNVEEWMSRT